MRTRGEGPCMATYGGPHLLAPGCSADVDGNRCGGPRGGTVSGNVLGSQLLAAGCTADFNRDRGRGRHPAGLFPHWGPVLRGPALHGLGCGTNSCGTGSRHGDRGGRRRGCGSRSNLCVVGKPQSSPCSTICMPNISIRDNAKRVMPCHPKLLLCIEGKLLLCIQGKLLLCIEDCSSDTSRKC